MLESAAWFLTKEAKMQVQEHSSRSKQFQDLKIKCSEFLCPPPWSARDTCPSSGTIIMTEKKQQQQQQQQQFFILLSFKKNY